MSARSQSNRRPAQPKPLPQPKVPIDSKDRIVKAKHITLKADCTFSAVSDKNILFKSKERFEVTSKNATTTLSGDKKDTVQGKYIIQTPCLEVEGKLLVKEKMISTMMLQNNIGGDTISNGWLSVPTNIGSHIGNEQFVVDSEYNIKTIHGGRFNIQSYTSFFSTDSQSFAMTRISVNAEEIFKGNGVFGNGVSHMLGSIELSAGDIVRFEYFSTNTNIDGLGRSPPNLDCVFSSLLITKLI